MAPVAVPEDELFWGCLGGLVVLWEIGLVPKLETPVLPLRHVPNALIP